MHRDSEQAQRHILEPLSTKWIEGAAGVSRDTVAAWRRGRKPRADQWERFIVTLDAWRAGVAKHGETPPPRWAEALPTQVAEAVVTLLAAPDSPLVQQLGDELERLGLLPASELPEGSGAPPGDAGTTPRPSMKQAERR